MDRVAADPPGPVEGVAGVGLAAVGDQVPVGGGGPLAEVVGLLRGGVAGVPEVEDLEQARRQGQAGRLEAPGNRSARAGPETAAPGEGGTAGIARGLGPSEPSPPNPARAIAATRSAESSPSALATSASPSPASRRRTTSPEASPAPSIRPFISPMIAPRRVWFPDVADHSTTSGPARSRASIAARGEPGTKLAPRDHFAAFATAVAGASKGLMTTSTRLLSCTRAPSLPTRKLCPSATSRLKTGWIRSSSTADRPWPPAQRPDEVAGLEVAGHRPALARLPEPVDPRGDDRFAPPA